MEVVSNHNTEGPCNSKPGCDSSMKVQCDTSLDAIRSSPRADMLDKIKKMLLWIKNKSPIDLAFLKDVSVTMDDLKLSLKRVQPSSKREGFATVPDVTWNDVGSLEDIREALQLAILVSRL